MFALNKCNGPGVCAEAIDDVAEEFAEQRFLAVVAAAVAVDTDIEAAYIVHHCIAEAPETQSLHLHSDRDYDTDCGIGFGMDCHTQMLVMFAVEASAGSAGEAFAGPQMVGVAEPRLECIESYSLANIVVERWWPVEVISLCPR
jgi:hypothetical protein